MIYLDNAATTLYKPDTVIEAVTHAMTSLGNAGRGATEGSLSAARTIFECRARLAKLFNVANPLDIAFTSNSTESLNTAIMGTLVPGDHVITTALEHNSVLRPLYHLEKEGVELTILPADKQGRLSYDDIEAEIKPNTKAIVCTHASNLTGNVVDIDYVGKITSKHNLLFIVDASQSAGVFDIDVEKSNIDILCFTGHKSLFGPQGTGGLYVREGVNVAPLKRGGSGVDTYNQDHPANMPTCLEAGTLNSHGIAGLSEGVKFILDTGISNIRQKEEDLMWQLHDGFSEIPGVTIYGDFSGEPRCPIVTINIWDYDSSEVSDALLMDYGISTRPGAHCAPLIHKALGTDGKGAVRFSVSYFNSEGEVATAIDAVREIAKI